MKQPWEEDYGQPQVSDQPWEQEYTQDDERSPSWIEVPFEAMGNLPFSAYQFGSDVASAVAHPIQTIDAVTSLGGGVLQEILPENVVQFIGEDKRGRDLARAVGQIMVDRYGSIDAAKKTIAHDPVGVFGDIAGVLGIGSMATTGRVSSALKKAADVTDPINVAGSAVKAAGKTAGDIVSAGIGMTTGVGSQPFREAYKAGKEGGAAAEELAGSMRGNIPREQVLERARAALAQMRKDRSEKYKQQMSEVGESIEPINFDGILNALDRAMERAKFGDQITDEAAAQAVQEAAAAIEQWRSLDPAQYHNALGIDALKRKIYSIQEAFPINSNAYNTIKGIHDSIKSEIVAQAPKYAEAMRDYQNASDLIVEIEKTLSLNPKASIDTALRKLQSIMRDNVQTNYGQRAKLASELEKTGAPLSPMIAGQALESWAPRGISQVSSYGLTGALAAAGDIPSAALNAAISSPRAMGELSLAAGKGARTMQEFIDMVGASSTGRLPGGLIDVLSSPTFRNPAYLTGAIPDEEQAKQKLLEMTVKY